MKDWKGCRGLEPAVALLVQNSMPPYLIGLESNDVGPFSASRSHVNDRKLFTGTTILGTKHRLGNPQWLELFKAGYGLAVSYNSWPFVPEALGQELGAEWEPLPMVFSPFTPEKMRQATASESNAATLDFPGDGQGS
ncbi:hypothetical protein jhhlp_001606 [Lomentospora prolificans]|uniref:Uncharacterized protein n=1 Tax=Lomentospora prolificans TaxID=41688 RepID=A0A2N3NIN7_9PEZI|nr:hypothetical protein jhhlp_001606 [Lomentospora prolificans]